MPGQQSTMGTGANGFAPFGALLCRRFRLLTSGAACFTFPKNHINEGSRARRDGAYMKFPSPTIEPCPPIAAALSGPGLQAAGTWRSSTRLAGLCLAVCLALAGCSGGDDAQKGPPPAPVSVAPVQQRDMERSLHVVGNVQSSASVAVKTRVTGELQAVHFKEGDHVEAGQRLFTIDPRPFEATLREAQGRLDKNQAQLNKAVEDMRRYSKLVGDGYISREAYEQAATDAAALRATVQADKAAVENAQLQLQYCSIVAPIAGRAGEIKSDKGNMIKANDETPMIQIDTLAPIYVNFSVPEGHLPAIQERLTQGGVRVLARPAGGAPVQGELTFMANTVDVRTGTIKLRGTFANENQALWPGQFVEVTLALGSIPQAMVVPSRAVQAGRNESYVYVVDAQNKAQYRKILTTLESEGLTVVTEGLTPGETVVTEGQVRLAPGVPVKIQ